MALETERLLEYPEEEQSKKKKAKASESGGDSKASASSSGPATSEVEVPRSKGGVPTAADAGDSLLEVAERKIGDGEPGAKTQGTKRTKLERKNKDQSRRKSRRE